MYRSFNHSVIHHLVNYITFSSLVFNIFKFCNFVQSRTHHKTARQHADCSFLNLSWFYPSGIGTWKFRIYYVHSAVHPISKAIIILIFFVLSAALFLFSHYYTCFVPQWKYLKLKELHKLLVQTMHLRIPNILK